MHRTPRAHRITHLQQHRTGQERTANEQRSVVCNPQDNLPTPKPAIIGVPGVQLVPLGPYGKELRWDPTPDLRTKVGDKVRHTIKCC